MKNQKRGVGRPKVFVGNVVKKILTVIKKHGLTGGRQYLEEVGIQHKVGGEKIPLKISLPTLGKLAKEGGIALKKGRPAKVAA